MEKIFRQVRRIKAHPGKSLCLLIIIIFLVYLILTFKTVWPFYSHSLPAIHPAGPSVVPGRDFPEKKWLHCVNSLDAARYAQSRYCGMEIDIIYDEVRGVFDIRHPPDKSRDLTLDALIGELKEPHNHYFWLDFKNLTDGNMQASRDALCRIAEKYGITQHIIVESSNTLALTNFSDRGFYTSYYLTDINPDTMNTGEIEAYIYKMINNLNQRKINAISANHNLYPLVKKYFSGYDLLMWSFTDNPLALKMIERKLLKDSQVKIILIEE